MSLLTTKVETRKPCTTDSVRGWADSIKKYEDECDDDKACESGNEGTARRQRYSFACLNK